MANPKIYDGNPIWNSGSTTFGYYDNDTDFKIDAIRVTKFCASRLGYPIVDVELPSGSFFTAFEEAINTYGNELYSYIIRDNQLTLEGTDVFNHSNLNDTVITPSFEPIIRLTEQYGEQAGVGGNVDYNIGLIALTQSVQDYDLSKWAKDQGISGSIEIKRVFHEAPSAISRYYDPYVGTGFGSQGLMDSMGFGSMSPAINYMMMPTSYVTQTLQAIEMSKQVRRSNYSFELKNNKVKLFPIPLKKGEFLKFEYIKTQDRRNNSFNTNSDQVTNVSNTPYNNPVYSKINSVGRHWIFEYTLAISKEMLGLVRGKYKSIPIPDGETSLNQQDLLSQHSSEKEALITRLRKYFDDTSRQSLLERRSKESEFKNSELQNVPYTIYVG